MASEKVVVVALEDIATAGVVAAAAAHIAADEGAARVVLFHVLDNHTVAGGMYGFTPVAAPAVETAEEARLILDLAEQAMRAELTALKHPISTIDRELGEGRAGPVIAGTADDCGACTIVIGARRPHALGRLTHPDIRASLSHHTKIPVSVVPLQAETPELTGDAVK